VGPLIDAGARDDVHALVTAAVGAGATVITGGAPVDGPGYFYQATVLGGVPSDAAILGQEIFGPVAPITTFASEEDAIRLANATEYGLASYFYSRDFNRLLRVAEQIEFGMAGFNAGVISNAAAPFGGVKQSGLGREGGTEGIAEYTTTQYIGIADPLHKLDTQKMHAQLRARTHAPQFTACLERAYGGNMERGRPLLRAHRKTERDGGTFLPPIMLTTFGTGQRWHRENWLSSTRMRRPNNPAALTL